MDAKLMALMATAHPTADQIGGLSRYQIGGLSRYQIGGLSQDQIGWLSQDQIGGLSRYQIGGLSRYQIGGLSRYQIGWLSRYQIGGLSQDQIGWLSQDQIGWLSQDHQLIIELAKNAPKVENLYSRIAADIASESRKLDQSTFGPEEPPSNLCKTPMCIAGHTVNMAGEAGYKLAHVFGFDGAARLIHIASRPEVSCPRYDSYPNEWALAYIQERAAEEKAVA